LQAPDGTFYALKHKTGWVTKIKYLRWGQAWMAYALAKAGEVLNEKYFKG
jgi:hypothetical protein